MCVAVLGLKAAPGKWWEQLQLVWKNDFETASLASVVVSVVWYDGAGHIWTVCEFFGPPTSPHRLWPTTGGGGAWHGIALALVLGPADVLAYLCYFHRAIHASM